MNNSRIKLLYITQSFGGVEIYIRQIIEYIDFSKFELAIIAPSNESFEAFCSLHTVIYHKIEIKRGIDLKSDLFAYWRIKKILKQYIPDIIHIHSSKAGVLGRLASSKLKMRSIFTPHGISYLSFSGYKRAIFFLVECYMRRYTDKVLTCSYSEKIKYEFEVGINESSTNVIANSIPIPEKLPPSKRILSPQTEIIQIGSIARLTYQKNPLMLVRIARAISDLYPKLKFEFSILGIGLTDHLKENVVNLIAELKLQNSFKLLGWGDKEKSKAYIESLDIFILPSIFEGLPLSLLEAMSLGTISIASKCDGCNDIIQHLKNGFACMSLNEYVDSISEIINDSDLQINIRKNAYTYVKMHHNISKFINELESYYLSI